MNHPGRPDFLQLAKLINKFRLSDDPSEIYNMAIDNYDALLELIENQKSVVRLALMAEIPVSKVRGSAEAILDSLLFNKDNDPCLSLGLRGNEDKSTVTKRWRQLITIFHPDKYPGSKICEEKAKRINEAYEEIRRLNRKRESEHRNFCERIDGNIMGSTSSKSETSKNRIAIKGIPQRNQRYSKFLTKIPFIIIVIMLFISLVAVFILMRSF